MPKTKATTKSKTKTQKKPVAKKAVTIKAAPTVKAPSALARYLGYAQFVTILAAISYGLFWAATGLFETNTPAWAESFSNGLLVIVVTGGVCMGVLYYADKLNK